MNKRLWAGCVAAALGLTIGTVANWAHAEEGRELTLSDTTVTAERVFTLSGDGCPRDESEWVYAKVGDDTQRWVPTGEDGAWSAEFQVSSATLGDVAVTAQCGLTVDRWDYAPSTVNVVFDGEYGTAIEPRLWLSHPTVTAGYGLSVSGSGCSGQVQVQVGEQTESVTSEAGAWRAGVLIPEGTLGELPVAATCAGDDAVTYPATVVNVVADGKLGFPPIPDAGAGDPPPNTSTPTTTPTQGPALPHTGW